MDQTLENYRKVYRLLEDDESKEIYLDTLNFLISFRGEYIDRILKKYSPEFAPMSRMTFAEMLKTMPSDRDIVFYGAGEQPRVFFDEWQEDARVLGFCSNNVKKQQEGYLGYRVMTPEELLKRRDVNVLVSTSKAKGEILEILAKNGFPQENVYAFPDQEPFREDPNQYFSADIIDLEEEVFVDAGCYDLSTSLALRKRCRKVKKVYAFEPDPANFEMCQVKKQETAYSQVELFPFGTWSENTELIFSSGQGECSHITSTGSAEPVLERCVNDSNTVPVVAIDTVVAAEDPVTFIKMDVEGAELESLKGARKTIITSKPKLAICIYHKPEDLIDIPLYVHSLVPEYKLFIRHHSNDREEAVLYAVMP